MKISREPGHGTLKSSWAHHFEVSKHLMCLFLLFCEHNFRQWKSWENLITLLWKILEHIILRSQNTFEHSKPSKLFWVVKILREPEHTTLKSSWAHHFEESKHFWTHNNEPIICYRAHYFDVNITFQTKIFGNNFLGVT